MLLYTVRLKTEKRCSYVTAAYVLHIAAKYLNDPDNFADHEVDFESI